MSKYFSPSETCCHCGCGTNNVNPDLLERLDKLREMVGGPLYLNSCVRCPTHNANVGGVRNSQHVLGNAADIAVPDYQYCHTSAQLAWYCRETGLFDAVAEYDEDHGNFVHVDIRNGGSTPNMYSWFNQG